MPLKREWVIRVPEGRAHLAMQGPVGKHQVWSGERKGWGAELLWGFPRGRQAGHRKQLKSGKYERCRRAPGWKGGPWHPGTRPGDDFGQGKYQLVRERQIKGVTGRIVGLHMKRAPRPALCYP